jgi:lipid-binding SYLF domain-containing protein
MTTHARRNRLLALTLTISIVGSVLMVLSAAEAKESPAQQRKEITTMAQQTLADLYKQAPSAKGAVKSAAGYGVFSNFGLKIFVLGTGTGEGVVVDKRTNKKTFMKMLQVGGGLGIGGKKFKLIFVFDNTEALNNFVNAGWEFGGTAEGVAKWGDKGGAFEHAVSVMPGVWVYQLTDKGVAADVMLKGTKYYKDDDLN